VLPTPCFCTALELRIYAFYLFKELKKKEFKKVKEYVTQLDPAKAGHPSRTQVGWQESSAYVHSVSLL
jgi:hypothetical protein